MRLSGTKSKVALAALLLAGGYAAYWVGNHLWGRHHYRAAQAALDRRDFHQAGAHFDQCLQAWPRDPSVRLLAAQTARRRGDLDEARRHLEAHASQKTQADERGLEYQLLFIQEGDLAQADRLLARCVNDPSGRDAHLVLETVIEAKVKLLTQAHNTGMTLVEGPAGEERTRAERAIELWRQHRPGSADQAQGLVWRGKIQLLINLQEACADFRQALELDPNHLDARLHLAIALVEYDAVEAVGHLEILRRREPRNVQVGVSLAASLRAVGRREEAERILDDILDANPDHAIALLERGKTAVESGRPQDAERFLRRALARTPDAPFVHLALSRCLHLAGKLDDAKFHQQRYNEIESERTRTMRLRDEEARIAWRKRVEASGNR